MKFTIVLLLVFMGAFPAAALGQEPETADAVDLPERCVRLLVESNEDPCSICAKASREKAFQTLEAVFRPGRIIKSSPACRFTHTDVLLTFRAHTAENHLVGIAASDYTEARTADLLTSSPTETLFEGSLEIIAYRYGDGPTYNYFPSMSHLQVHCRILELKSIKDHDQRKEP